VFIVHLRDGRTLKESDGVDWSDVPAHNITSLQLYRNGKYYTVTADGRNVKFIQLKRAITGSGPMPQGICERVIGLVTGDMAVKMQVDEKSGDVKLTVESRKGGKWKKL